MLNRYVDGLDKKLMKKKGFNYCKEVNKFVYEGYGVYLKDIDKKYLDEYLVFFEEFGYDLVFGPMVSGNYIDDVGLFCRNYIDVLCDREMLKEDIDSIVKRIILVSKLKDEIGDSSLYLEKCLILSLKWFKIAYKFLDNAIRLFTETAQK